MMHIALCKAHAAEIVYKDTQTVKDSTSNAEIVSISTVKACYCCGKADHGAAACKFKTTKCHAFRKLGT